MCGGSPGLGWMALSLRLSAGRPEWYARRSRLLPRDREFRRRVIGARTRREEREREGVERGVRRGSMGSEELVDIMERLARNGLMVAVVGR